MRRPFYLQLALYGAGICLGSSAPETTSIPQLRTRDIIQCPEDVGASLWSCAMDACGGEDPAEAGRCLSINAVGVRCKCSPDVGETQQTIVTDTVSSSMTIVATYALQTISSLSGLSEDATQTMTRSSTASDGTVSVETEVALVMAGGAVWVLAGTVGDAAALESVPPPPDPADPQSGDKTCPSSPLQCSDCSGVAGVCVDGEAAGCVCETQSCPEQKPRCDECDGKDGKCQSDDARDCECEQFECPTGSETPHCDECGGLSSEPGDGPRCSGNGDGNDKYRNCPCTETSALEPVTYQPALSRDEMQAGLAAAGTIGAATILESDGTEPVCQNYEVGVTQRDADGSVSSTYIKWCGDISGKSPDDKTFIMTKSGTYPFWLSAFKRDDAPDANSCETATIQGDECTAAFDLAMTTCDPGSGDTHGAAMAGACINYSITIDRYASDPDSPPWNRLTPDVQCDTDKASTLEAKRFEHIWPQFCTSIGEDQSALSKSYTQDDYQDAAARRLLRRTPPPSKPGKIFNNDWKFDFDWSGSNGQDCHGSCTDAYYALTQSGCGTLGGQQNMMAASGTFDARCGTFKYTITPPSDTLTECQAPAGAYDNSAEAAFQASDAEADISNFCSNTYMKVTNPATTDSNFYQTDEESEKSPAPSRKYTHEGFNIHIEANFADVLGLTQDDMANYCSGDSDFTVSDQQEGCERALKTALNNCYTETTSEKHGSFAVQASTQGCVTYMLWGTVNNGPA